MAVGIGGGRKGAGPPCRTPVGNRRGALNRRGESGAREMGTEKREGL